MPRAVQFIGDAFGYDSGPRAFCAPDFVEFLNSGGDPGDEARTPDDGMDAIPRAVAARFEAAGGEIRLEHELMSLEPDDGAVGLAFANGEMIRAARIVMAIPVPALRQLTATSSALAGHALGRVFDSVEGFPAMKLYLWYAQPWWRPAVRGIRSTTDLPIRKLWYFDGAPGSHSVLLGMYTDGLDVGRWTGLYEGGPAGAPAPPAMLAEVHRQLRKAHPDIADIPAPIGSALMYWGADRHEIGWHFWRSGENSDEILRIAPQPDPALPVYLANEAFSAPPILGRGRARSGRRRRRAPHPGVSRPSSASIAAAASSTVPSAQLDVGVGGPDEHRVVRDVVGVARAAEVAPEQHDRLLRGVRVAAFPARPRIGVRAVHDRDDAIGPVEALEVLQEDRLPGPFRGRVLLRHEDLVPGGAQARGELHVELALRRREQWPRQVDLHVRSPARKLVRHDCRRTQPSSGASAMATSRASPSSGAR